MFPPKILIIMSGSIAAAKASLLVSSLVKKGCEVQVVCTKGALQFIGEATLEGLTSKKVLSEIYENGQMMGHIHLMRWADTIVVAPATANFINKIALGVGDDLASTLMLAHQFDKPVFIAPAMNTAMYLHPTTQSSLKILKNWGMQILDPSAGVLACGEDGPGRLLEPALMLEMLENYFKTTTMIVTKNKKILITSGGTSESIDGVRILTNVSSGQTGLQLAQNFQTQGYDVTFVHSTSLKDNSVFTKKISFFSYDDLFSALKNELSVNSYDAIIHLAAVSDYSVEQIIIDGVANEANHHLKINSDGNLSIQFKKNQKIISNFKSWSLNSKIQVIGFKLTQNLEATQVLEKVEKLFKNSVCDYVVHNDLNDIHKENGTHKYTIYSGPHTVLEKGETVDEMFGSLAKGCNL